jgi:hypothetical protein
MKKTIIVLMVGIAVIFMSFSVSANTLLMPGPMKYEIGNTSIMGIDKCVCPECAEVMQNVTLTGGNAVMQSTWLCDTCLCPYYITESPDLSGWYLFSEDICMTGAIKWKSFGWILAVNNKCTNFDAGPPCNETKILDNRVVVCGDYKVA